MKFYSHILIMKKETFLIFAVMILWIGMVLWTFFWWTGEKPEVVEEPTWFIEQIVETWNVEITPEIIPEQQPAKEQTWTKDKDEYTEINVMMPRYFYTAWRKSFAQDLYKEKKVYMNFTFMDNLNEYRDIITSKWFSDADLVLIPYDRLEYMNPYTFSFQNNISSDFDNMVSSIVNNSEISFLPFAADPMIMYTLSGNEIHSNFADIQDFVYDWTPRKNLSFPVFFWITPDDYDDGWFLREYQDIVRYALIHYFVTYRDANSLEDWIETNLLENYKITTLNSIIKKMSDQNCNNFPSICMQLYNYVTIRFWFLSDQDVVNQYFSTRKSEFREISKNITPMYPLESLFRVWWWSIPYVLQDKDKEDGVYTFLAQYMKKHASYPLWNSTLSVFAQSGSSLMDNEFIWVRWSFMESWWKFLEIIRNTRSFRQLLEHQISANDYLRLR